MKKRASLFTFIALTLCVQQESNTMGNLRNYTSRIGQQCIRLYTNRIAPAYHSLTTRLGQHVSNIKPQTFLQLRNMQSSSRKNWRPNLNWPTACTGTLALGSTALGAFYLQHSDVKAEEERPAEESIALFLKNRRWNLDEKDTLENNVKRWIKDDINKILHNYDDLLKIPDVRQILRKNLDQLYAKVNDEFQKADPKRKLYLSLAMSNLIPNILNEDELLKIAKEQSKLTFNYYQDLWNMDQDMIAGMTNDKSFKDDIKKVISFFKEKPGLLRAIRTLPTKIDDPEVDTPTHLITLLVDLIRNNLKTGRTDNINFMIELFEFLNNEHLLYYVELGHYAELGPRSGNPVFFPETTKEFKKMLLNKQPNIWNLWGYWR